MTEKANESTTTPTITSNGEFTLRSDLLGHMGISPGDQIDVVEAPNDALIFEATRRAVAADDAAMISRKQE